MHFRRDYFLLDRRLNRTTILIQQSRREKSWRRDSHRGRKKIQNGTPNQVHQAIENNKAHKHKDDSDPKPFTSDSIGTIFIVKKHRLKKLRVGDIWFLELYVFRHLSSNWKLFSNLRVKSIDFMTVAGQVIRTEKIGTVSIPLAKNNEITLQYVALAPGSDSNLISFGQLQETEIIFHDDLTVMTLMKNSKIITQVKKNRNLFTLELAHPGRAMAVTI